MNIDPNAPAFPIYDNGANPAYLDAIINQRMATGLTIRAELAARNYAALISTTTIKIDANSAKILAEESVMCADALIELLNKKD